MALSVQLERDPNRLRFEAFPDAPLDYREDNPQADSSFLNVTVTDTQTKKTVSVFLKAIDLQDIGVSITTWKRLSPNSEKLSKLLQNASVIERLLQMAIPVVSKHLAPRYLTFFKDTAYANRIICGAIHAKKKYFSGVKGVPGMYFSRSRSFPNVFINLRRTSPLGEGTYGKVRKVVWLNPSKGGPKIVAKKVLVNDSSKSAPLQFRREIDTLCKFSGKRGIIPMISGVIDKNEFAIFLPVYECSLSEYFTKRPFRLSLDEKLNMISQWLEGLAVISEEGIHGDIKPENLLLKRGNKGIKGVIADFGGYCFRDQDDLGVRTFITEPPEYCTGGVKTVRYDTWGMGLSLHEIFSERWLPCWQLSSESEMALWTSKLAPDWILQRPTRSYTPPFILKLINEMLDPRPDHRPSPKEAFERFAAGYSAFIESSKKSDVTG